MNTVKLGDVVVRIKDFVDKDNTELKYYIGGEHFEPFSLTVKNHGIIKGRTIGPAFHHKFKSGDVLLMSRNPHLRKAGIVDFDGVCSDVSYVIRTKDEKVLLQRFIPFIFQSDSFWEFAEKNKKGSTNFFLNWSDFEKFEFDLPDIDKQKMITEILWSMNSTMDSYKNFINESDNLIKSQFIEMFDFKKLPKKQLSEICDVFTDGDWIESKDQSHDGIWLVQTGNIGIGCFKPKSNKKHFISNETFKKLNCTEIFEGDIIISRLPDPVGRACILPKLDYKCITAVDCTIIRLKDIVNKNFFIKFTNTEMYYKQLEVAGATRPRVSRKNLGKVLVPIPSMEGQNKFSKFVEVIDKSKVQERKELLYA